MTRQWCSTGLPVAALLFGLFAACRSGTHLFQDMVARFAVLLAFGSGALGLEQVTHKRCCWAVGDPLAGAAWRVDEPDPVVLPGVHLGFLLLAWQYCATRAPCTRRNWSGCSGCSDAAEDLHSAVHA